MPPREPIPLDYRPGKMVRAIMALTDRGEAAVKRGRTPFAPAPFVLDPEEPPMSQTGLPPPPAPVPVITPTTALSTVPPPATELRIVPCQGGWIVYVGDRPAAVASDKPALGATVASLV